MRRPFEGFGWGAMALLSKAPQWSDADYAIHAERLEQGLLGPAACLVDSLLNPLAERLGQGLMTGSATPLKTADGYVDYTLLMFTFDASPASEPWLRLRIGHDTVGFACGATPASIDRWNNDVLAQLAVTSALIHHPTLSVIGFAPEAQPPVPPPRRPMPFAAPAPPPSPALVGRVGPDDVRIGWHDPLPPTSTLPRFVPFCLDRLSEFRPFLDVVTGARGRP